MRPDKGNVFIVMDYQAEVIFSYVQVCFSYRARGLEMACLANLLFSFSY